MRIFEKKNYNLHGRVLPLDEFKLMRDATNRVPVKEKLLKVLNEAEADLNRDIPALPLSLYRAYRENGSTVAYGAPYCERMYMALRLTVAEIINDDKRYVDKLLDVVWAMLDESTWVLPEHVVHTPNQATHYTKVPGAVGDLYPHGLELGACYRGALIALVYSFVKDKFDEISPLINERIIYELKNRIINPFLEHRFLWSGYTGTRVNNWCPWNIVNILTVFSLIEEDTKKREEAVRLSLEFLDNFINEYGEDGGCEEGPTYWNAAAACLFDSLELLEDLTDGYINVYDEPIIRAMGEYEARVNISGLRFVNFADSHSRISLDGDMLHRYGEKCSSDIISSLGDSMYKYEDVIFDIKLPYRTLRSITTPRKYVSDSKPCAATDTYLGNIKVMVLRDSKTPSEGMFLAMKGGHNAEMHNHNDVGSFIVYKNGEPVLIDAGVGTYTRQTFSKDRYKIWSMQSLYHNLPSFDGVGQLNGAQFRSKNEVYDKDARSLTLDITEAYPEESGLISYVRKGSLNDGVVTVTENIRLNKEKLIDFVFVTHREPKIIDEGSISLAEGATLIYPKELDASVEVFDPVGMDTVRAWGTKVLYRIHLKAKADKCDLSFIIK